MLSLELRYTQSSATEVPGFIKIQREVRLLRQKVTDALLQRVAPRRRRKAYSLEDIRGIMLDKLNSPTSPLASINTAIQHILCHYETAGIAVNSNTYCCCT